METDTEQAKTHKQLLTPTEGGEEDEKESNAYN
jgi:hypothetical protein